MTDAQQIVFAALLKARADGDDASATKLEALLADPEEAAALVKQLSKPA